MEETRPFVPTVADHPRHLPRLQLRPGGPTAASKGPANGMGGGVGLGQSVASGTSLAEPGSGVSADTLGTLPWGQPGVMAPERYNIQSHFCVVQVCASCCTAECSLIAHADWQI